MNTKTITLLALVAAGTIALAAITLQHREEASTAKSLAGATDKDGKARLFPGLLDKVNDVVTVAVRKKGVDYTFTKTGDTWGLAEKDNFPIEVESVRKMLLALGEMHKLEAKTKNPSAHATFGVEDPDAEGAESARITLKDASGAELAQLVCGKEHDLKGAGVSNQRYVRKAGDDQTWLVQGTFDLREKGVDYLKKQVLEVKRDRIRSVEVTQPDGEILAVDRASPTLTDFTLIDIPEGKELTYPTAPGSVASGLEYVNLEDVEPRGKIDYAIPPGPVAKFKTFDGLVVTVTTTDKDGKSWAKFEASYEAPPAETQSEPKNEGEAPKAESPKKSPEEVQKEVADLNARLSKWDYQISSYTRANFGKKKSEILKDKAPPPAPVDPNAPKDPNAPDQDAMHIPSNLPPEIQAQIKEHQESLGNKVVIAPPKSTEGEVPPADAPKPAEPSPADPHDHDHDHPH